MPSRHTSRTITQIAVTQGAAGSLDLVAAPGAGLYVHVVGFYIVLDAAGTLKFQEAGTTDLTGVIPVSLNGVVQAWSSESDVPVLSTKTANSKLNLVSGTGKALGWLRYFLAEQP